MPAQAFIAIEQAAARTQVAAEASRDTAEKAFFEVRIPLRRNDSQPDNSLVRTYLQVEKAGFNIGCAAVEAALCVSDIRDLTTV